MVAEESPAVQMNKAGAVQAGEVLLWERLGGGLGLQPHKGVFSSWPGRLDGMGAGTRGRGGGTGSLSSSSAGSCGKATVSSPAGGRRGPAGQRHRCPPVNSPQGKRAPPQYALGFHSPYVAGSAEGKSPGTRRDQFWPSELGRKVKEGPCQVSASAEGALWAALREGLAFALQSRCQRHRQRGPWHPAEGPSSLAGSRFSCGHPDGQCPTLAVSGGIRACARLQHATWPLSTPEGP